MKCFSTFFLLTLLAYNQATATKIKPKIIGGFDAHPNQFPFAAAIYKHAADGVYFYAGTILTNKWILTTGQCVKDAIQFTIQVGSVSLSANDPNRVHLSTSTSVIHPDFNSTTLENDLGLIQLRIAILFTDYIKPVDQLPLSEVPDFVTASALGWGQVDDEHSGLSDKLRWTVVTTITNDECKQTYGNQITDNMLCTEGNYNEGICNGDIGGPLIQYYSRGISVVAAVSSFISGLGCEQPHPSGYSRTYPHVAWIKNVTGIP